MKIAITGASGFIGRAVVQAALESGHEVLALMRNSALPEAPGLKCASIDLCQAGGLIELLSGCDAVIHLAAVMQGANQYHNTMLATRNVLSAMDAAGVTRLVGLSSIAVLDYVRQAPLSTVDEQVPSNGVDADLGPYARMKRDQEQQYLRWHQHGKSLVVLRPGLVYSAATLADAHAGFTVLGAMHEGEVPVVHVDAVAQACVRATMLSAVNNVVHLVNDSLPQQKVYIAALRARGSLRAKVFLPWRLYGIGLALLRLPLSLIGKVPDALRRNSVAGRQKPFRFSNQLAKRVLQWQPAQGLAD